MNTEKTFERKADKRNESNSNHDDGTKIYELELSPDNFDFITCNCNTHMMVACGESMLMIKVKIT